MISVVMPAHNEEGYLEPAVKTVLAGLANRDVGFEVIVVENGSRDASAAEADRLSTEYASVSAVHLDQADYGAALREGFLRAGGEIVVNFDVDLVDLDFLDRALAVMADPAVAVVVGTKLGPGSQDHRPFARRLVTASFSTVLRRGFGLRCRDTHGLKTLRRSLLASLVEQCRFGRDIFDTELILRAERAGLTIEQIPVAVEDTRPPRTPIARRIPPTLAGLARLWWALRHGPVSSRR